MTNLDDNIYPLNMLVKKTISLRGVLAFSGHHFIWLTCYMIIIAVLYGVLKCHWVSIPWLPVSLIGTAVAFYVGFKNNQSYDRVWEARKIWGAIVNSSRAWGVMVNTFIRSREIADDEVLKIKKRLIYRHIAWLYTLREQLLVPAPWEHINLSHHLGQLAKKRREKNGIGLYKEYLSQMQSDKYFEDALTWEHAANKATQIVAIQASQVAELEEKDLLHMRKQLEMQKVLTDFYDHQGSRTH